MARVIKGFHSFTGVEQEHLLISGCGVPAR